MAFSTLTEGFESVYRNGGRTHFIGHGGKRESVSFDELRRRALVLLAHLHRRGLGSGDELIICTDHNQAFIDAFWACQFGGIVPVPIAPGLTEPQRHKLFRVYRTLARPYLFTDHQTGSRIRALADKLSLGAEYQAFKSRTILIENVTAVGRAAAPVPTGEHDVALIQFSSGSTSDPKGVVLTHRNLCVNIQDIHSATGLEERDVSLSWMPLTHDMGLIGFHLAMLMRGASHHIMATDVFVRRPTFWLQAASECRATVLCSPNFGYRLFLKAFERWKIEGLDLSQVRLVFNGAEPISAAVCEEFLDALEPYGLRRAAMVPVYGLAEASLGVSISDPGESYRTLWARRDSLGPGDEVVESSRDSLPIVAVGAALPRCAVRITGAERDPLPPGRVGRIEISGPNVTRGYYDAPRARSDDGWLDTGDLGFVKGEQLYVTGRTKDVIFVNGQNFYAHDLENIAAGCPGLDLGKVAVSAVRSRDGKSESAAVFVLHFGDAHAFAPIAADVRRALSEHAGVEVENVVPVDHIPRTTSGKLQRYLLAQAYTSGRFDDLLAELDRAGREAEVEPDAASDMERSLLEICASSLGDVRLQRNENFFEVGMNSLKLVEIHELIDQRFPGRLEVSDLFDHPTLARLAAFLESKQDAEDQGRRPT